MTPATLLPSSGATDSLDRAPRNLRVGVFSLWLYIAFGVIQFLRTFWPTSRYFGPTVYFFTSSIVLLLIIALLVGVSRRHGWCRWVLIPLVMLYVVIEIPAIPGWLYVNIVIGVIEILRVLAAIIGIAFVLTPSSRRWFRPALPGTG